MKDYNNLHLKWYLLLLANAFEKIRKKCLENLCPNNYLSAPALR